MWRATVLLIVRLSSPYHSSKPFPKRLSRKSPWKSPLLRKSTHRRLRRTALWRGLDLVLVAPKVCFPFSFTFFQISACMGGYYYACWAVIEDSSIVMGVYRGANSWLGDVVVTVFVFSKFCFARLQPWTCLLALCCTTWEIHSYNLRCAFCDWSLCGMYGIICNLQGICYY